LDSAEALKKVDKWKYTCYLVCRLLACRIPWQKLPKNLESRRFAMSFHTNVYRDVKRIRRTKERKEIRFCFFFGLFWFVSTAGLTLVQAIFQQCDLFTFVGVIIAAFFFAVAMASYFVLKDEDSPYSFWEGSFWD
jgi:hypothetical protein